MKIIVYPTICLLLISGLFVVLTNGQTKSKRTNLPVVKKVDPIIAEAEKAWAPFWKDFRTAIKDRNREAFKQVIAINYSCYDAPENGCSCNKFSDKRDVYFCQIESKAAWHHDLSLTWWSDIGAIVFHKRLKIGAIEGYERIVSRTISYGRNQGRSANFSFAAGRWYFENSGSFGSE